MSKPITETRKARIADVLSRRQKDLTLVMDNIWDPHNVSAILRSCDAFGVLRVHLHYTKEPFPDIGKKSSASGWKWVERTSHRDTAAMLEELRGQGCRIIRTGFSKTARPLFEYDFTKPTAVILGNEHTGVCPELVEQVEDELFIPMQGMIPSFNVSVAGGLILYEAFRQREAAGMYQTPSLSSGEIDAYARVWSGK